MVKTKQAWQQQIVKLFPPNDLHAFIVSIEIAYFKHYPLKLSPSQIWILILQSIGIHIDQNAEKLRDKFVSHQDKKT